MTKGQVNAIFEQFGGKETFIKEKLVSIQLDNTNIIYNNFKTEAEQRIKEIVFDDDNELLIYYSPDASIMTGINDYTPINVIEIYPYDVIQNINVLSGLAYKK
jgi:hypothetical protein